MTPLALPGPVVVMGAGAVGCYVGGRLAAAGVETHFVGRPRVLQALAARGLTLTDLDGRSAHLPAGTLHLHEEVPGGMRPGLVLLCVKSGATAEAAEALGQALPPGTAVLSLQNGVANVATAQAAAPGLQLIAAMVPFNVAEVAPGHWHRGTSGEIAVQDAPALDAWQGPFAAAGLRLERHADLRPVQWAKLLLNLNNPVNALSGLPLKRQLLDPDLRHVVAALQTEALAALAAHGIRPARLTPVPPSRLPAVLKLPTWAFRLVAARSLRIDERARSSMADDVALGRRTEIDALCGEIVRLACAAGLPAPCNEAMVRLLLAPRPAMMSGRELRAALGV